LGFTADAGNNRVLVYYDPLGAPGGGAGDTIADLAVGQPNLTSSQFNGCAGATLATLCLQSAPGGPLAPVPRVTCAVVLDDATAVS
jgi:hypothetical protein